MVDQEFTIADVSIKLQHDIPAKHKFTLNDLAEGDEIIMYGVVVGICLENIPQGGLVGTHNIVHKASNYNIGETSLSWEPPDVSQWS